MKIFDPSVMPLMLFIVLVASKLACGEPSMAPPGLPSGAKWVTEESYLDKAAGIKQLAEGYQLFDMATQKAIRIGAWKFTTSGTTMYRTEEYNNSGRLNGPKTLYLGPGRPQAIVNYVDGVMEGKALTYHPETGALMREAEYKVGMLNGWVITYSPDGKVLTKVKYVDGEPEE